MSQQKFIRSFYFKSKLKLVQKDKIINKDKNNYNMNPEVSVYIIETPIKLLLAHINPGNHFPVTHIGQSAKDWTE